jgi:retron-type reverse transcriptase
MKRTGHLFEHAFTEERLYQAYLDARKSKRQKRACFQFERRIGSQIHALLTELHDGRYQPRPYYQFVVREPKPRLIHAPAFRDCVVQHAIYQVIYPLFDRTFIAQSYACRPGFGTHKAADYAQRALRQCAPESYTLKLDVRRFFYSIDRSILRQLIERKIKDRRFVDVMMLFAEHGEPLGIPIGNLLSQLYALIYLNPLDHFVKRDLGIRLYCRYVDDSVLFGLSQAQAFALRDRIVEFLNAHLKLQLSKSTIAPVSRGINFVGYRTWRQRRFIRKRALYVAKRAIASGDRAGLVSSLGHAKRTASLRHLLTSTRERNHELYCSLPESYRPVDHAHARHAA